MKQNKDPLQSAFNDLHDKLLPTAEQKEKMLNYVLLHGGLYQESTMEKIGRWITVYPWRFAFGTAAVQAIACTLMFGSAYTNLVLRIFGG